MTFPHPYRLVALDLDGTLLTGKRTIAPSSIATIKRVRERGIEVILVTGRHHTAVYPYHWQLELNTPAICCNGTYVYDFARQRVLTSDPLDKNTSRTLVDWSEHHGIHMLLYSDDVIIYREINENLRSFLAWSTTLPENVRPHVRPAEGDFHEEVEKADQIWKFLVTAENSPAMADSLEEIATTLPIDYEWSWDNRVDINPYGNSKGRRLEEIARRKGLLPSEVLAIGDQMNDITMLRFAGMGVAMGNAREEVKETADYVTAGNEEDGVAAALERFVL